MSYLDKLQSPTHDEPLKIAERGALLTQLGFARAGLDELRKAAGLSPDTYWIEAQLAETQRVYVRDVILRTQDRLQDVHDYVVAECLTRFAHALSLARAARAPKKTIAWIRAHAGAAQTLLYFVLANSPSRRKHMPSLFDAAMASFEAALQEQEQYPWCLQLQAYLLTLRGQPNDFERARRLLGQANDQGGLTDAALDRNLAMLQSYEAAALGGKQGDTHQLAAGVRAAKESIEHGFEAMRKDPDDALAAYTVAASLGWLHLEAEEGDCKPYLESAISAARVRAHSTLARTYATLAGLALLEQRLSLVSSPAPQSDGSIPASAGEKEVQAIFELFESGAVQLDVESWALLNQDPIWRNHPLYRRLLKRLSQGLDVSATAAE